MTTPDKASAEKLLPFLKHVADTSVHDAGMLRFDKQHPQQLYAICAYGSMVEMSFGIVALAEHHQVTSMPILLRSLLEAYASFRCCIKDPNHFKSMYASFAKEKRRLLRTVEANPDSPYLKKIADSMDLKKELLEQEKLLKELKDQGYAPLSALEHFTHAGLEDEYHSLYWQLCMHAHNNVSALEDRHIEKNGDTYEVAFFKEEDATDLVRYLDSVCGILLHASKTLHNKLGSEAETNYDELFGQLKGIRAQYA